MFKRDETDNGGHEIYLWYNETRHTWYLGQGSRRTVFKDENTSCMMYIKSQGEKS